MNEPYIIVIEDDPMSRRLMYDLLEVNGYEVAVFADSESALVAIGKRLPSLVLMDIRLPGRDGFSALQMLRADRWTNRLPVIAVTASVMLNEREKILRSGFTAYHPKPIQISELLKLIAQTLADAPKSSV